MAGEIPSGEGSVFHFLDIYALGFGLEACGALFLGKSWWWVALGVIGSIFFHLLGTNWPRIKPIIGPRFASSVEQIASNRLYRRAVYCVLAAAATVFLASTSVRLYRHYRADRLPKQLIVIATTTTAPITKSAQSSQFPPTIPESKVKSGIVKSAAKKQSHPTQIANTPAESVPPPVPGRVRCSDGTFAAPRLGCEGEPIRNTTRPSISLGGSGLETSISQLPSQIHFERVFAPNGADLSGCVSCSISDSQVGPVKAGVGPVVLTNDVIQGGVICAKRGQLLADVPEDCRAVALADNRIDNTNAALDNTNGKIGEAYVSGNIVRPPFGGGTAKAVENSHGEIQKLTDTNNDIGWPSAGAVQSALPIAAALHGSNSALADQLSEIIDKGNALIATFVTTDNAQALSESEIGWEEGAKAIVSSNLDNRLTNAFDTAPPATEGVYPGTHGMKGISICNLIRGKISILITFVNQLRTAGH